METRDKISDHFIPMNEQTALHELTHVILNEIGFTDIEIRLKENYRVKVKNWKGKRSGKNRPIMSQSRTQSGSQLCFLIS